MDLGEVYHAVETGVHVYRLRSLVCYYGAHYFAFVLVPGPSGWLLFDDTRVSSIGSWEDVKRKVSHAVRGRAGLVAPRCLCLRGLALCPCASCLLPLAVLPARQPAGQPGAHTPSRLPLTCHLAWPWQDCSVTELRFLPLPPRAV